MHGVTKYATAETLLKEQQVRKFVEKVWAVELHERPHFDPIDWDILSNGVTVGCIELKSYNRTANQSPTVIMNLRKYIALRDQFRNVATETGNTFYKALYMVNFIDEIRYIEWGNVRTGNPVMGGQKGGSRSTDWEPIYQVPVSEMVLVTKKGEEWQQQMK